MSTRPSPQSRSFRAHSHVHTSRARSMSYVRSTSGMSLSASLSIPNPYAQRIAMPMSIHACLFSAPWTSSPNPCACIGSGAASGGSRGRFSARSSNASTNPTVGGAPRQAISEIQPRMTDQLRSCTSRMPVAWSCRLAMMTMAVTKYRSLRANSASCSGVRGIRSAGTMGCASVLGPATDNSRRDGGRNGRTRPSGA